MNWTEKYRKAFVLSYDDGVYQDIRLVQILNQYGLKCTFNLNAGLMDPPYVWEAEGVRIERMPPGMLPELYKGHEIASHTLCLPPSSILILFWTVWADWTISHSDP